MLYTKLLETYGAGSLVSISCLRHPKQQFTISAFIRKLCRVLRLKYRPPYCLTVVSSYLPPGSSEWARMLDSTSNR